MTIIEADGQNTEPLVVDSLQIYVAQRYSFVVCRHLSCKVMSIYVATDLIKPYPAVSGKSDRWKLLYVTFLAI